MQGLYPCPPPPPGPHVQVEASNIGIFLSELFKTASAWRRDEKVRCGAAHPGCRTRAAPACLVRPPLPDSPPPPASGWTEQRGSVVRACARRGARGGGGQGRRALRCYSLCDRGAHHTLIVMQLPMRIAQPRLVHGSLLLLCCVLVLCCTAAVQRGVPGQALLRVAQGHLRGQQQQLPGETALVLQGKAPHRVPYCTRATCLLPVWCRQLGGGVACLLMRRGSAVDRG